MCNCSRRRIDTNHQQTKIIDKQKLIEVLNNTLRIQPNKRSFSVDEANDANGANDENSRLPKKKEILRFLAPRDEQLLICVHSQTNPQFNM